MPDSPNILFIFADQLRYSAVGCDGNRVVRTPHLDQLAREGVVFDQAFASCPICAPYRGNILTGRYAHANGVMCNQYSMRDDQVTIAHALRRQGYRTAYVGKLHLGYGPYPERKRLGFDDMIAYNCAHDYYKIRYHHNEAGPFPIREYAPRGETQLLLDWIARHRKESPGKPFCAFLGWGPPHWTEYAGNDGEYSCYPQEYKFYKPQDMDVPGNVPVMLRDYVARELADYYGMVTSLDDCMGRIMRTLDAWGLSENTILCFSSDHGDHLSAHGYGQPGATWLPPLMRNSKATPYEESVHVPFILRYPAKVAGNRRTDCMFGSVDVMPTLMGLAGAPLFDAIQGKDLSHVALGEKGDEPDSVYLQILGDGWPGNLIHAGLWSAVRTHTHLYARYYGGDRLLFDRQKDPLEMKNLVSDPASAGVLATLEARLKKWMADTGDPFDTGPRLPDTNMLDLGQRLIAARMYSLLTPGYRAAIEKYRPKDLE